MYIYYKVASTGTGSTERRERPSVSTEMTSGRSSTLSEEQPEMDEGRKLLDARMQPVVKLYRIGM